MEHLLNRYRVWNMDKVYTYEKISKGRVTIKKKRSEIPTGSLVCYQGKTYVSAGMQHYGEYVTLKGHKAVKTQDVTVKRYAGAWVPA